MTKGSLACLLAVYRVCGVEASWGVCGGGQLCGCGMRGQY